MIHELVDQVNAVMDGEIVAIDEDGKTLLRAPPTADEPGDEREIKRIAKQIPVALVAFDLLWLDGRNLTAQPLEERRGLLQSRGGGGQRIQLVTWVEGEGSQLRGGGADARAGGGGGQAPRLEVLLGPALARLAEDQAHSTPRTA